MCNTLENLREEFSLAAITKITPLPVYQIPQVGYQLPFAAKSITNSSGHVSYPVDPAGRIDMHLVSYMGDAEIEVILCREMPNINQRARFIRWIIDHTVALSNDPTITQTITQYLAENNQHNLSTHAIAKLKHFVRIHAPKRINGSSGGGDAKKNIAMVWWIMIYGYQDVENAVRIVDAFRASCSMIDSAPILELAARADKNTDPEVRIIPIIVPTDNGSLIMVTFVIKLFPMIILEKDQRGKAGIDLYSTIVRGTNGEICVPPSETLICKSLAFYRGISA